MTTEILAPERETALALQLRAAVRRVCREEDEVLPSIGPVDELLDERSGTDHHGQCDFNKMEAHKNFARTPPRYRDWCSATCAAGCCATRTGGRVCSAQR